MSRSALVRLILLAVAWILFLVSLFGPALAEPFPLTGTDTTPVHAMIVVSLLSGGSAGLFITCAIAPLCFLLSPILVLVAPANFFARIIRTFLLCGLGSVWVPLLVIAFSNGAPRHQGHELLWGYYVFATAHALALVACVITPLQRWRERAQARGGFPVVTDDRRTTGGSV